MVLRLWLYLAVGVCEELDHQGEEMCGHDTLQTEGELLLGVESQRLLLLTKHRYVWDLGRYMTILSQHLQTDLLHKLGPDAGLCVPGQ